MALKVLTDSDVLILKELVRDYEQRYGNGPIPTEDGFPGSTHEIYLARLPDWGATGDNHIPAYDGTDAGIQSCDLMSISPEDGKLAKTGMSRDIFNFSYMPVLDRIFPVVKDQYGRFIAQHVRKAKGKADGAISKGSTGTVSLWTYNGSAEVDSTINVSATAWGAAITSGKIVTVEELNGRLYVGPWEC